MNRWYTGFYYVLALGILLISWELLSLWVNSIALPSPRSALGSFFELAAKGSLRSHFLVSAYRVTASIALALVTAVPLGLFLGRVKALDRLAVPLIFLTYPIPKIVFLPVFMALFGLGDLSKITLVALIVFYQILVTTWDEARSINQQMIYSVTSLGAGERDIYRHVLFPAVLPKIFTSMRISLGTAIAVLFIAETYATNVGLGYFLIETWSRGAYDQMYAGIIGMGILGFTLYQLFSVFERILCPWTK